jgi:uncharacterized membrane protein YdjX (TVP38/TMEM64 family)
MTRAGVTTMPDRHGAAMTTSDIVPPTNGSLLRQRTLAVLRILAAAAVVVALAGAVRDRYGMLEQWLLTAGPWALPLYLLVYVVVIPLFFPVSVMGFLAGAIFGFVRGTALLLLAGLVAGSVMYGLGRWIFGARVRRQAAARPRLARFLALAEADSVRLMVLLRLSPLHFGFLCYILGAGRVRFLPYLLTTALVLPSAALQAWVGSSARTVGQRLGSGDPPGPWHITATVLTGLVGRMAKQALESDTAGAAVREQAD